MASKKVIVEKREFLSYFDTELFWEDNNLYFRVHLKLNQEYMYLNRGSTHTRTCFYVIPSGVLRRLQNWQRIAKNENKNSDELYPDYVQALKKAELGLDK